MFEIAKFKATIVGKQMMSELNTSNISYLSTVNIPHFSKSLLFMIKRILYIDIKVIKAGNIRFKQKKQEC